MSRPERGFRAAKPVNVAVNIKRLRGYSSYIGAVGNDENGTLVLSALESRGVDVSRVRTDEGNTTVSHVVMNGSERTFAAYDEGVMAGFRLTPDDVRFICGHDLFVTSLWGHCEDMMCSIKNSGVPTAFDASKRPFSKAAKTAAPHTDIFFFSDDRSELDELKVEMKQILDLGAGTVVAMRGKNGSMAMNSNETVLQGIVSEDVLDTMGAGDSFIAGFLTSWVSGRTLKECMKAGAESAAVTICVHGAWA